LTIANTLKTSGGDGCRICYDKFGFLDIFGLEVVMNQLNTWASFVLEELEVGCATETAENDWAGAQLSQGSFLEQTKSAQSRM
jgi:hypothetical protein